MKSTCHSEYGKIESIFLKTINKGWLSQEKIDNEWEALNFLGRPDYTNALKEYDEFQNIIRQHADQVYFLEETENLSLDSIYCRDAALATDHGMILCNMGKVNREPEPNSHMRAFIAHDLPILGQIQSPGTLEGGDMAWIDHKTLVVGRSYRTNHEGIEQLKHLLKPYDIEVIVVDLPHFRGPSDIFHLMSIISPLDKDLALVYSPAMPISFRNELIDRGFTLVECPEEEFDNQGCNVLALSPRKCLMVGNNPITRHRLLEAGSEIIEYQGADISAKGGGGPTCLTRPIKRII